VILIALGSNMWGPWGSPEQAVRTALTLLDRDGLKLVKASRLIHTAPFGRPNQPDFINAVARIETHLPPMPLLQKLHAIEKQAGRKRTQHWGPRTLDLDIVDYGGLLRRSRDKIILPHPGIADRIFVLKPITEIAPRWRHPVNRSTASDMLRSLKGISQGREI
jgi:2-amino-4-hydroxy-6-hydroxymethyldihydropteridine diphosphokinase